MRTAIRAARVDEADVNMGVFLNLRYDPRGN